ncbi:hypothetical protein Tsubulata_020411 [Turnera subulata]|uniref:Uncharacterized protein n=1 Tax=Turnera subulata TaxID=218843 RepID=A0A9Q0FH56_9ROSI|nr:hypothetical protein Tsubulata_020411 [Turnera subulata]
MRKRKPTRSSASPSIAFLIIKIRALEKNIQNCPWPQLFFFFFARPQLLLFTTLQVQRTNIIGLLLSFVYSNCST